ncbi:MAG TPA: hypothetical protein VHU91_02880 [Mycobacteriales bacterium]|nr:hypothetical protein [Mycobacteriales bacterium]
MSLSTTIKVPKALRDRLAAGARSRHVTQAKVLSEALDALEERDFWTSVDQGYARLQADPQAWREYVTERDSWVEAPLTGEL